MRLHELFESNKIDQAEADAVYQSLKASGDHLAAFYFQATRNDAKHSTIDSAQRSAERMAAAAQKKIDATKDAAERSKRGSPRSPKGDDLPTLDKYIPPKEYSDKFRGNQYVKVARSELPPGLKQFLPILDQGLIGTFTSNFDVGKRIAKALTQS